MNVVNSLQEGRKMNSHSQKGNADAKATEGKGNEVQRKDRKDQEGVCV